MVLQNSRRVVFIGIVLCCLAADFNGWYKNSMSKVPYCTQMIRTRNRDRFLASLFVPQEKRDALLAVYALEEELKQVHCAVNEEIMGEIRYAWWQEALDEMVAGKTPRAHPVLQALPPESFPGCLTLAGTYRESFPDLPAGNMLADEAVLAFLRAACPQAEAGWRKAGEMIAGHRRRFGNEKNMWLDLKLLWAGFK